MATGDPAILTIDSRELRRALKLIPDRLHRGIAGAFTRSAIEFEAAMDDRFTGSSSGAPEHRNTGSKIVNRTGALARSVGQKTTRGGSLKDLTTKLFIGDRKSGAYARIQEFGGTIKGKPWLTIPLPDALTASGVARYPGGARSLMGGGDGGIQTWIHRTDSGNLIIQGKIADDPTILNLWLLRRSVTVPARLGFNATFHKHRPRTVELVNKAVQRAIVAATKGT